MPLPTGWVKQAASLVAKHLKRHEMAGLPHINVLGPSTEHDIALFEEEVNEENSGFLVFDRAYSSKDPEWKFFPNRARYQVTVDPFQPEPLETDVSFFIRIRDGCDDDLFPPDYKAEGFEKAFITPEELEEAFMKVQVQIKNFSDFRDPVVKVLENGKEVSPDFEVEKNNRLQVITVRYKKRSDLFLVFEEGAPRVIQQDYRVYVRKIFKKNDKNYKINVEVRNLSPKTSMSRIPHQESLDELRGKLGDAAKIKSFNPILLKLQGAPHSPEGNRFGYLMECELSETVNSGSYPFTIRDASQTINIMIDDSGLEENDLGYCGRLVFKDYALFSEEVPKMTTGSKLGDLFERLGLDETLSDVFSEDLEYVNFYKFQERAIEEIVSLMRTKDRSDVVLMSARTAGGKTEAFMVPLLQECIEREEEGTKALVFYPTKALANSQASRFISVLYHLNKRLSGRKITIGVLHGDIPRSEARIDAFKSRILPLECPVCAEGRLEASEGSLLRCNSCGEVIDFVKVRHRRLIYSDPPDILITNPDTLMWDIMVRPYNHSIFGRPFYRCNDCGRTYAPLGIKKVCDECRGNNIERVTPSVPSFIVFDEVHLCKGTFGINTSLFLSRLENLLENYSKRYHGSVETKLVRIGSTATIANPRVFAKTFFNVSMDKVRLIPKDQDEMESFYEKGLDENIRRYHFYLMPYAYSPSSTIGRIIDYLQSLAMGTEDDGELPIEPLKEYLRLLTFVNSVRASNMLISLTKRTVAKNHSSLVPRINGHTTDFDRDQRAKIETDFNKGNLNVIFATSTLEVGVDFRRVDCVIVYGFPFSFNDYIQRIGRAGRREDALIISVCQNWKPVDHFYFINAKSALRNPQKSVEPVPITRSNVSAFKKHALGCVFDFIMSRDTSSKFDADFRKFQDVKQWRDDIVRYTKNALMFPTPFSDEILGYLDEFLDWLETEAWNLFSKKSLMNEFIEQINGKYQLTQIRSTDKEIPIEIRWF